MLDVNRIGFTLLSGSEGAGNGPYRVMYCTNLADPDVVSALADAIQRPFHPWLTRVSEAHLGRRSR